MARSRYTSWHWQPTSKVATQIKQGGRRYRTARELQISQRTGDYTMAQVKAALESNIGPIDRKPAKRVPAKKTPAKSKTTGKANVTKPAANGHALKAICGSMDTKLARRKLRKAGIKGHDAKARWVFTDAQLVEVRKMLGLKSK